MTDHGPLASALPERTRDLLSSVIKECRLSDGQMTDFEKELLATKADGTALYSFFILEKAVESWKRANCGQRGKGWRYFMGIVRGCAVEAKTETARLSKTPPVRS